MDNAPLRFVAAFDISDASISRAQKKISSAFNSANLPVGQVTKFDSALGRVSTRASEFQRSMDAATARVFAFGAAVGVINAITQSFKALVAITVDVEKKLTLINSIFGASAKEFGKFREDIFRVAQNTGQSFSIVADGAAELARQGLGAVETAKRLNDALILTRISGLDSAKSVESLTAAINGFSEAGLTSSQIINKLIAVDNSFAVSSKDLAEGLARAGSTAQDAGVSFDELLGLVTAVQQKTARGGAVIGNAFKTIFARISRGGAIEDLKALGVEIDASQTGIQKLKAISNALNEISDPTIAAQIRELAGGVFQLNVISAALKDLSSESSIFAAATAKSAKASNEAYKQNATLSQTTAATFNELVVAITNAAEKIGQITLTPIFSNALAIANKFIDYFNQQFDPEKGNKIWQGFFGGIANFLSGPGIITIGLAFGRILQLVSKFAKDGLRELLSISDVSRRNADLQKEINFLLENDERLRNLILGSTISTEQKERLLLDAVNAGNLALAKRANILKSMANSMLAVGITKFDPKKGFVNKNAPRNVPNFAKEYPGLREALLREVTGTGVKPSQVRVNQHSKFATRQNPAGIVVTNTRDEPRGVADIPNFALTPEQKSLAKQYRDYKKYSAERFPGERTYNFRQFALNKERPLNSPALRFSGQTTNLLPSPANPSALRSGTSRPIPLPTASLLGNTTQQSPFPPSLSPSIQQTSSSRRFSFKSYEEYAAAARGASNPPFPPPVKGQSFQDWQKTYSAQIQNSLRTYSGFGLGSTPIPQKPPSLPPSVNTSPTGQINNSLTKKLQSSTKLTGAALSSFVKDLKKVESGLLSASQVQKKYEDSVRKSKGSLSALTALTRTSEGIFNNVTKPLETKRLNTTVAAIRKSEADKIQQRLYSDQVARQRAQEANSRLLASQALVAQGASAVRRPSAVRVAPKPLFGISDKRVSRFQSTGSSLSSVGLAAAFGLAPIQNALISSNQRNNGVSSLNKKIEQLTKEQDKSREAGDEAAVAAYEESLAKLNRELSIASQESESFSKTVNQVGAGLTAAAFILPQLLAAGGNASRIGAVGGTVLGGAALGLVIAEIIKRLTGFNEALEKFFSDKEQKNEEEFNNVALATSAATAASRLKLFEKRLSIASDILNKQFSATIQKTSIGGVRSEGQVAFDRVGLGGIRSKLSLGQSLGELADEYFNDDKKNSLVEKTASEGQTELAKISLDIKDNFNTLASALTEVSYTGDLAQKQLESYEKAFKTTIGKNPLEQSLKQFAGQNITSATSPDISFKNFLANEILTLRKTTQGGTGDFAEGANRQIALTGLSRQVQDTFGQLSSGNLTNERETELIGSLLETASAADKLAEQIGAPANLNSFSDLINRQLEARAQLENSLILAEKQQALEELSARKKIQDDFISKLKETFESNLDKIPFDASKQFPSKSSPAQLNSFLQSIGLNQTQSAGIIESSGTGNIFSPNLVRTEARDTLLSILQQRNPFTAPGASTLSAGESGLIKKNVDIAGAEKNINSILSSAGITGVKDFASFFESIGKGSVTDKSLGLADTGLSRLESLQGRGRIGEDQINQIATTLAGVIQSIAGVVGVAELPRAQVTGNVISGQVQDAAAETKGLAETNINTALTNLDKIGLSFSMKFETVTQSVLSGSESVANALNTAADRISTATANLLNTVPATKGAVAPQPTPAGGS